LPFCHAELRASKPKPNHYPKQIKTLGDHIRAHRLDLKLLQKKVADQISVDEATITNWERNAAVPAIRFIPAIIQFLGQDPLPPATAFPERLVIARRALGLSQRKMAESLGVDPGIYRVVLQSSSGEQKSKPSPSREFIEQVVAALNQAIVIRG
jgi:transcriptional regulator with XRE-family HTH domain